MQGGHGDQNSEKHQKKYQGCKTTKMSFKNIKMWIFRVIVTYDRRYNFFDLKKKMKDMISKNFKN